jgi:DNA-binding MarR family transcriptional regulator
MISTEKETELLEQIYKRQEIHQRDLAEVLGISLGMTNAILKRLAKKGLITIQKVNNRNIMYAVSPEGIDEIARRSYRFFKRTIRNVVFYKQRIENLISEVKQAGYTGVNLVGTSDVDFIVQHACFYYGLEYHNSGRLESVKQGFLLFSESHMPKHPVTNKIDDGPITESETAISDGRAYLRDLHL